VRAADAELQYRTAIRLLLEQNAFANLDAAADSARRSKQRLEGGVWQQYVFYDTVANPVGGERASSADWDQRVAKLQGWIAARPQSVAPRIALAEAYRTIGWKARGHGFAETVTEAGWQELGEQDEKAYKTLVEAGKLTEKCPHWFFVMLEVARDQGWDKEKTQ